MRSSMTASTEIKQLFGRIDRQLKRLIDIGESEFSSGIPADLLRQLLLHILQSDSPAGRVGDIREIYLAADSERRAAADSLSGCNETLYSNVSAGACERIEQLRTRLDAFMATSAGDPSELAAIADEMHSLGNTVRVIGLEQTGGLLIEQAQQLRMMSGEGGIVQESGVMPVANTLLAVDGMLREFGSSGAVQTGSQTTADHVYREGVGIVIREEIMEK